jgi:hypothetical protein
MFSMGSQVHLRTMESLGEDGNLHDIFATHKYSANAKSILREAAERVSLKGIFFIS